MTLQEFFDETVKYAMQMKHPCKDSMDICFYRDPEPDDPSCDRCWIGKWIPDDKYDPRLEGAAADDEGIFQATGLPLVLARAACQLQRIHDTRPMSTWRGSLIEFAHAWNLTLSPELA